MTVFEFGDEFTFIFFVAVAKEFEGVGFGDVGADDFLLLASEFKHFVLNFCEVGIGDGVTIGVDVVVKAVFDGGADAEFHAGE